jgi:hypothetical protein
MASTKSTVAAQVFDPGVHIQDQDIVFGGKAGE